MSATALGTWSKPPLAYVVAELVISPYYSMATKVPGLQDRLRNAYPKTLEAQELIVDVAKPTPQPVWNLLSATQNFGVQIGTRSISMHVTSYMNSSDLLTRWAEVLDAIHEADLGAFVERAGLRYVDLIVPIDDRSPSEYVVSELKGITPEGAKPTESMWAAGFLFDGAVVNLRVGAPSPAGMLLPPNFNAMPLHKPKVMVDAEQFLRTNPSIGFIDTDCLRELNRVFDAAELLDIFTEMQRLNSRTFKAALSAVALVEWM